MTSIFRNIDRDALSANSLHSLFVAACVIGEDGMEKDGEREQLVRIGVELWFAMVRAIGFDETRWTLKPLDDDGICLYCEHEEADTHADGCMYSLILNRCYTTKDVLELAKYGK